MIFEILAATMLVINLAAVVLTLSAIGHLHTRVADNARFQSVLFRKSLVAISDTLEAVSDTLTSHVTKEFEDRNYQYEYLADCASRCTYALTQDPDFKPLDSAESVAKFADDTFATFDAMHPGFKSYRDNPATEEEAKALKIPMPHSQPQSVFDGASFGAASSRRPIFERKEKL